MDYFFWLLQDALAKLQAGRTTLVIAHRLSTIREASSIAVVQVPAGLPAMPAVGLQAGAASCHTWTTCLGYMHQGTGLMSGSCLYPVFQQVNNAEPTAVMTMLTMLPLAACAYRLTQARAHHLIHVFGRAGWPNSGAGYASAAHAHHQRLVCQFSPAPACCLKLARQPVWLLE